MKAFILAAGFAVFFAAPVSAEIRYDRNLEMAVMRIVASKIGNIRGGFDYGQKPQIVVMPVSTSVPAPAAALDNEPVGSTSLGMIDKPRYVSRIIF